ncbi:hypothetical protein D7V97_07115 [Corallococcus sp. CA053C]|nr:hypothetical protein D7V97_07115 [Corallococcus sp. CA053C]
MSYDSVGNQFENGKGQTIQYTSFDLPAQVSRGQATTHYKYDGAHRRVLKTLPNGDETLTLADVYERRVQAGLTNHVFSLKADGSLIAQVHWHEGSTGMVESEQVFYVHADPLGTPSAITDAQGQVVERMKFAPFGGRQALGDLAQEMDAPSFLRNGFQGHSVDDESQLVNMKGRMYDPALGAFLTPDPVVSSSLNRYRFGVNNPLKNTDPSGFNVLGWGLNIFRTIGGGGGGGWGGMSPNPIPSHYDSVDWNYRSSHGGGTSNTVNTGPNTQSSSTPRYTTSNPTVKVEPGPTGSAGGAGISPRSGTPMGSWVDGAAHAGASVLADLPAAYALSQMPVYQSLVGSIGLGQQLTTSIKEYGVVGGLVDTFNPAGKMLEHGWLASEAYDSGNSYAVGEHAFHASIAGVKTILAAAGVYRTGAGALRGFSSSLKTISASARGNPAAIFRGLGELSPVQSSVLERLNGPGAQTIVSKRLFGNKDLTALTAATGDEFAMFSTGGRRLIVRGTPDSVPITPSIAARLRERGWRWSSHTHPGDSKNVLRSSDGDRAVLEAIGNKSAIFNSIGERRMFTKWGDSLDGWTP